MSATDRDKAIPPQAFLRLLFSLALPISLQFLLTSSMAVIDILMIGRLHDAAVAAVGIANQFVFIFFGIVSSNVMPSFSYGMCSSSITLTTIS